MYHYTECGLPNIYLANGYHEHDTPYGPAVSIEDVEDLHKAIGTKLAQKKSRLSGAEIRFLRKELDLSQKQLGEFLEVEDQTVALWEKDKGAPKSAAEIVLRVLYLERAHKRLKLNKMKQLMNSLASQEKFTFEETDSGWMSRAA